MKDDLLLAYVPVVHRGYVEFFRRFAGAPLLLFGESILKEIPYVVRDMRAVAPCEAAQMLRSLDILGTVSVVELQDLPQLRAGRIIMPDEEISRTVAQKYLNDRLVDFERVFLRWDKKTIEALSKVNPDHSLSREEFDQAVLGIASQEGQKTSDWWRQIGAVVVRDRRVLFAAHNAHMPSEHTPYIVGDPRASFDAGERIELSSALHAEVGVIALAAYRGVVLAGADLYVTTFPCTGCSRAIAAAGFRRVFYAEGYSQIEGEETLRSRGIEIIRVSVSS